MESSVNSLPDKHCLSPPGRPVWTADDLVLMRPSFATQTPQKRPDERPALLCQHQPERRENVNVTSPSLESLRLCISVLLVLVQQLTEEVSSDLFRSDCCKEFWALLQFDISTKINYYSTRKHLEQDQLSKQIRRCSVFFLPYLPPGPRRAALLWLGCMSERLFHCQSPATHCWWKSEWQDKIR